MKKTRKNKGFTLVELIVVIAILVILAAILIPTVTGYIKDAKMATANANARTVYTAARAWLAKNYDKTAADCSGDKKTELVPYLGSGFDLSKVEVKEVGASEVIVTYTDSADATIKGDYWAGKKAGEPTT